MSKTTFPWSFPLPFWLPLARLLFAILCAPNFSFDLSSPYHQILVTPSSYLENWQLNGTDSSYHLFFCLSTKPKGKGRNEDEPSRQPHMISFKCCPPAGFPMQYLRDGLVPELCICTAHPNNSCLLQKVVLQLRVTPSMMKSTKCLIKVNATVPMVKQAICMTFLQSTTNMETSWSFAGINADLDIC